MRQRLANAVIAERLLKLVKSECKKHKVKLIIAKGPHGIDAGILVNGYFDPDAPSLLVATGKPVGKWMLTLAHEYCHMTQWVENCPAWQADRKVTDCVFNDWVAKPKLTKRRAKQVATVVMRTELDCERRAAKLLARLGYDKVDEYIQKANAYTMFYWYVAKHRKWYKLRKEPYHMKKVWSNFPTTFEFNRTQAFKRLEHLYDFCVEL